MAILHTTCLITADESVGLLRGVDNLYDPPDTSEWDTTNEKVGQKITATHGWDITSIKVQLQKFYGDQGGSAAAGNIVVEVHDTTPDGALLATGTYDRTSLTPGVTEVVEVILDGTVSLSTNDIIYVTGADPSGLYYGNSDPDNYRDDTAAQGDYSAASNPKTLWLYSDENGWQERIDASRWYCQLIGTQTGEAHAKATNPTPANADTEVDFSTPTLAWDGTGEFYNVRGGAAGNFVLLAAGIADTEYTLTTAQQILFKDGIVTWRVDSILGEETLTGDDWTFDPRPGKATGPTPANTGSDIETTTDFEWTMGANGSTNELLIGGTSYLNSADATYSMTSDLFGYDDAVTWRVDTTNYYGTTEGTEWTFDAMSMDHLRVTYTLIDGGSGLGPYDTPTPGVEGTDYWFTGANNVITLKRLIVVSKDRMLYESL